MAWEESAKITTPHLLLVEGRDDEEFFLAYLEYLGFKEFHILQSGKIPFRERLKFLATLPQFTELKSLGIVRDADDSAGDAFKSICDALKVISFPVPKAILLPTNTTPKVNILIMPPNNEGTGRMLEDLCLASMNSDPAMLCVSQYFECLAENGINHRQNVIAKAHLRTFLASRSDPDKLLGQAAQAGYWNFDSPVFDKVKTFLQQLAQI